MDKHITFDLDLIRKYDVSGPRYTSYPTAVEFHEGFDEASYKQQAIASNTATPDGPLSLYFHIPFCNTVCFYCGCNKVVTKHRERAAPYLQRLHQEIAMQGELFDRQRPVTQLHWGGGTPTFISHDEMRGLMRVTGQHFRLLDNDGGEYSIEVDPREVRPGTIALLREIGFNRMSLGVQDFDPKVQQAVNRIQSEQQTVGVLNEAREHGFQSLNLDLIYGLPHQSVASFSHTLDRIIAVNPDRLSVFNYAHLPERFKPQRRIHAEDLPSPGEKLDIMQMMIEKLSDAGFVYIGMDHFAKPDDPLTLAQQAGTLYRNFQGYSTHADCDLVAMGITSIGSVNRCFAQNVRTLEDYNERIDGGRLAVYRGIELTDDDILRQAVIRELICHFKLKFAAIEQRFQIDFHAYFEWERPRLQDMAKDGLIVMDDNGIQVSPAGHLLIRNICMVFDTSLRGKQEHRFSKVI